MSAPGVPGSLDTGRNIAGADSPWVDSPANCGDFAFAGERGRGIFSHVDNGVRAQPCLGWRACPEPARRTSPPRSGAPTGARWAHRTSPLPVNQVFGANVFSPSVQRQRLPPDVFKRLQETLDEGQTLDPDPRRRRRRGDEGMGDGEGRHALHALVPAAHRLDRGEARLLLRPHRRRRRDRGVLRQGADPGRARRLLVPDRRHPGDVRGPRLHRLGPDLARLHPREPQRRAALHPDRVRVVDGRGARPQDPAAALDGRAVEVGRARAAPARRRDGRARVHHGRRPSRSTS